MALSMIAKYDKYWGNVEKINPLLFVGNVLDSRFKLDYITWSIEDTCTEDLAVNKLNLVKDTLEDLY
ncbi:putative hAT-like transposase, RNase-H [Lupinus albus]|uniref:Putative hAT-like transposase, RNase-H n=1 Tax=Lupinus albus TaxID=3870 RepID=A0A6A4PDG2_LUPAL|nr:putative hAT-like transposase, RNase-H [Lupinus albus]